MKKLLFALIIPFVLIACKKDDPDPVPEIASIVGKWKHIAYEKTENNEKTWVPMNGESSTIIFRYDGLILDSKGLRRCCAPYKYNLNGVPFEVKPKEEVPVNAECSLVDCIGCEAWTIEQTGDEMIITLCEPTAHKSKYIRQ